MKAERGAPVEPGSGGAFGLLVLQTDEVVEGEVSRLLAGPGRTVLHSRVASAPEISPETLAAMKGTIPPAAALLPARDYAALGYACTSGATVLGSEQVSRLVQGAGPRGPVTDPLAALKAALAHIGARRIGFLTPYAPAVSAAMRANLESAGFEITAFASFEEPEEARVARIDPADTGAALERLAGNGAEALFAACTNLAALDVLPEVEARTGLPALSSNLVLGWHMLRLAGLGTKGDWPWRLKP